MSLDAYENDEARQAFIAAANPAAIRDLVLRVRKAESALVDAQHDRDEFRRVVRALTTQTMTAQGMADCMDMLRGAMIEAKVIDPAIAPMFFAEQIIPRLKRLEEIEKQQPTHFLDDKGELHPYTADKFQLCESQGLRRLYARPLADTL